jgi:hypothetical protein
MVTFGVDFGQRAILVQKGRANHEIYLVAVGDLLLRQENVNVQHEERREQRQIDVSINDSWPPLELSNGSLDVDHFVHFIPFSQSKALLEKKMSQ